MKSLLHSLVSLPGMMLALALPGSALAQPLPGPTDPVTTTHRIDIAFDRAAGAPDIQLWPEPLFVLGFSLDPDKKFNGLHLVCGSNSDPTRGACVTEGSLSGYNNVGSYTKLRFVEERSSQVQDLSIHGYLRRVGDHERACGWLGIIHGLHSNHVGNCPERYPTYGTGISSTLEGSALNALPPGRWRASLVQELRDGDGMAVATHTFNFQVDVTDDNAAEIYFPDQPVTVPHVGLNLRRSASTPATLGGEAVLNMCLYDGRGSQSSHLELEVRDEGKAAPGRTSGRHSAYRQGGGEAAADRIDFETWLDYEGRSLRMENGQTVRLDGTDHARLRRVRLPGMLEPVYCVPTPLTLRTPAVSADSKTSGYYRGRLTVQMTIPTTTP